MDAYSIPKTAGSSRCGPCAGTVAPRPEAGCSPCEQIYQAQVFARPQFFAGQLLTEDDLQSLTEYVMAKNRLHNRFLFGEGVVCGLEVTCHPCGGGTVVVHPGYALDCCGNDIVLSCAYSLDINAMVYDLRREMLCGDPCKKKEAPPKEVEGTNKAESTVPVAKAAFSTKGVAEESDLSRHYCLYAVYSEEPTDPVSPYALDEPCGRHQCQPTRIREGLRFQLRCRESDPRYESFIGRVIACIGDMTTAGKTASQVRSFWNLFMHGRLAINVLKGGQPPELNQTHADKVKSGLPALQAKLNSVKQQTWTENTLWDVLNAFLPIVSIYALIIASGESMQEIGNRYAINDLENRLKEAMKQATYEIIYHVAQTSLSDLDKAFVESLAAGANKLLKPVGSLSGEPLILALSAGLLYSPPLGTQYAKALISFLRDLHERVAQNQRPTDCALREDVRKAALQDIRLTNDVKQDLPVLWSAVCGAGELLVRYLRECFCSALTPACRPCDDPAVPLACIEVKECEVVSICNMDRNFVFSPAALRYWLPIDFAGDLLEQLCCADMPWCREALSLQERDYVSFDATKPQFMMSGFAEAPWSRVSSWVKMTAPKFMESVGISQRNIQQVYKMAGVLRPADILQRMAAPPAPEGVGVAEMETLVAGTVEKIVSNYLASAVPEFDRAIRERVEKAVEERIKATSPPRAGKVKEETGKKGEGES